MPPVQTGSKLISSTPLLGTSHVGVSGLETYSTWHALTPPSSSRSPPLKEAGPGRKRPARDASIYNARPLLRDPSQDMKRTFVCASSCIKHYVQPSYGCRGTPVVACMCVYTALKNYLIHKIELQKVLEQERKTLKKLTKSRDAAAKKEQIQEE